MARDIAEMELASKKRKQLQALCKKHGIPANKTNRELVLLLTIALKVSGAPARRSHDEGDYSEENVTQVPRKRVRFNPQVETREYEPTACKQKVRITTANAIKVKKANLDVQVDDEAFKNVEKAELSKGSRKRNEPKGTDSEPKLVTTRIRARRQSARNTTSSAVNKQEDPSRRQIQTVLFGSADLELKGETRKRKKLKPRG